MTKKNSGITGSARGVLLHLFFFFLAAVCLTVWCSPCLSESNGKPDALDMRAPGAENANYCKPAEISLSDRSIRAGLLYDVAADAVVWEKNKDQSCPIASVTKMMVALIAAEDIAAGKVCRDTVVRVTPEAASMKGSKVYLRAGCCLTIEELLKAALISSGNDAAYLLAQFLGGTEPAFVKQMNRRAMQLGMTHTFYSNATGMPAPDSHNDNHSSPSDLLLLSLEILKHEDLLEIVGMSKAVITQDNRAIPLRNHNGLLTEYDDVDGFKTGFTLNAKYCLVATANKGGRRLISIVLGVPGRILRNQFTATAISRYYEALGMGGLEPKTGFAAVQCVSKPVVSRAVKEATTAKEASVAAADVKSEKLHHVRRGETLYKIATRYGCDIADLKAWNHIRGNRINPGQKLAIYHILPGGESGDAPEKKTIAGAGKKAVLIKKMSVARTHVVPSKVHIYKVRRGDTLWKIAQKFEGATVKAIMKANRIKKEKDLKPGATLKIMMNA